MSFLQPLGLLGLIAVPIIIIIYIIKSRYVQKPVASTFIWKRSLKYVKRKIPLSIILSLLLILQILTVVASSLSIARPTVKPLKSNETIYILDASASMQTLHEGKTRFDVAKEYIVNEASGIGSNSRVSVIYADSSVDPEDVLISRSDNKISLGYSLEDIICTDGDSDIEGALEEASKIQEQNAGATIKLITDKDYENADGLEVVNISRTGEFNVSILSVTDEKLITGNYQYTAEVVSYGRGSTCSVGIFVDDKFMGSKNVVLPNTNMSEGGVVKVVFTPDLLVEETDNQVVVRIDQIKNYSSVKVIAESKDDGIQADNTFYLFSEEISSPRILFISNKFKTTESGGIDTTKPTTFHTALASNGFIVKTEDMFTSVEAALNTKGALKGYDLYIFECVEPPTGEDFPSDGAVWMINPKTIPDVVPGVTISEETNRGAYSMILASQSKTDTFETITKNLESIDLGIYRTMTHGDNFEKIFSCDGNQPALIAGTSDGIRMVITSFDLNHTSLPVMVTDYVILLNNLVKFSMPDVLPARDFEIGQTVQFNAPAGANKLTFKYEGVVLDVTNDLDMEFVLDRVGIYEVEVEFDDELQTTATYKLPTHIPNNESNIVIVGETVEAAEIPADIAVDSEPVEIFPYIIALLILLLVTEWGVYHRDGV